MREMLPVEGGQFELVLAQILEQDNRKHAPSGPPYIHASMCMLLYMYCNLSVCFSVRLIEFWERLEENEFSVDQVKETLAELPKDLKISELTEKFPKIFPFVRCFFIFAFNNFRTCCQFHSQQESVGEVCVGS